MARTRKADTARTVNNTVLAPVKLDYPPEYFDYCRRLLDKRPLICEQCRIVNGKNISLHSNGKTRVVVRLALRNIYLPANDIANVGLFCTKCRHGKRDDRKRLSHAEINKFTYGGSNQ